MHTNNFSVDKENPIIFTNGFFLDIEYVILCTNDGYAYLYHLPENVNPQSTAFRQKSTNPTEKYPSAKFVCKFATNELTNLNNKNSVLIHFFIRNLSLNDFNVNYKKKELILSADILFIRFKKETNQSR